ncbi:uncharacterized protein LOC132737047 [Ruditapes philippinarum]|uniref:uncharacterized protein LOC132737047 n=1 Tax=Ruditapes philippinarum TaxID=129788 RepID=UPI00295B587F|nr:uncharacterized protein LOC132737047 [Ruditapes philippinarum]
MADGSWKPDIICLKNVIFRVVTGNGLSTSSAWKNGTGTTADVHCRVISTNTSCNGHYRDPIIDKWDTLNVQTVRYSIYKNFEEVAWIDFDGIGSSNTKWFEKSRIINSSYQDISSSSTFNYLQIEANINAEKRRFYASVSFGGCKGDILYFVTVDSEGSCWYDQIIPFPSISYSKTQTMANTSEKENFDFGDTAVVSLK